MPSLFDFECSVLSPKLQSKGIVLQYLPLVMWHIDILNLIAIAIKIYEITHQGFIVVLILFL